MDLGRLRAPAGVLAALRQAEARRLGVALDRVSVHYSLSAKVGAVALRGVRLLFARSDCRGGLEPANALYSEPVCVYASFSVAGTASSSAESPDFPVFADQGRREELFRLEAICADPRLAVVQGVGGVVRVLE